MADNDLLTMAQVCAEYQISEETVRRWIREKRIPFVAVGPFRMKRISRAAIETPVPAAPIDPFDPQATATTPPATTLAPKTTKSATTRKR